MKERGEDAALASMFDIEMPAYPYPGLRAFEKNEWMIYFGRERATDKVVSKLLEAQFVALHGDSGCGKSSLVRAGVLPRLEREYARGGATWRTGVMLPRAAPLWNLATALAELESVPANEDRVHEFRRVLNLGSEGAEMLAKMVRRNGNDYVCILVDQFEEIFQFAGSVDTEEAQHFIDILTGVQRSKPEGLHFILTMRSEFLGSCAGFEGLADTINETQYLLPRMERSDLVRALCEPAQLYNGVVKPDLAQRIIGDAGTSQDQLPLMQHAVMLLYRRAVEGLGPDAPWSIGLQNYEQTGGPAQLLSDHADQIYRSIAGQEEEGGAESDDGRVVRQVFQAITEDAEGHMVRRPQTVGLLTAVTGVSREDLLDILAPLRGEGVSFIRIFPSGPDPDKQIVDISHEALMRNWKRLQDWMEEEAENGAAYRRLLELTEDYQKDETLLISTASARRRREWWDQLQIKQEWANRYSAKAPGIGVAAVEAFLDASLDPKKREFELWREELAIALDACNSGRRGWLSGPELELARRFNQERGGELTAEQKTFVQSSIAAADKAQADAQRRRRMVMIGGYAAAGVSATFALAAILFAMAAGREEDNAKQQATRALAFQSQASLSKNQAGEALGYALAAIPKGKWKGNPSPAENAAIRALRSARYAVRNELFSFAPLGGKAQPATSVAFSKDGKRVVAAYQDGAIASWDAETGKPLPTIRLQSGTPPLLSSDGLLALTIGGGALAPLKTAPGGPARTSGRGTFATEMSRVRQPLGNESLRVWRSSDGQVIATLPHEQKILFASFNVDGSKIISTSEDNTVRVWNSTTGIEEARVPTRCGDNTAPLVRAAISPNGRWIVGDPSPGKIRFWEVATKRCLGEIDPGISGWKTSFLGFNQTSDHLLVAVIASGGGRTTTSGAATGNDNMQIWAVGAALSAAAAAPKSKNPPGPKSAVPSLPSAPEFSTSGFDGAVSSVLYGSRQHGFAVGLARGSVEAWNEARADFALASHRGEAESSVSAMAESPDLGRLAYGRTDGAIRIWDTGLRRSAVVQTVVDKLNQTSAAISADGTLVYTTRRDAPSGQNILSRYEWASGKVTDMPLPAGFTGLQLFDDRIDVASKDRHLWFDPTTLSKKGEFDYSVDRPEGAALDTWAGVIVARTGKQVTAFHRVGESRPVVLEDAAGDEPTTRAYISDDGERILIVWANKVGVWDTRTGKPVGILPESKVQVVNTSNDPNAKNLFIERSDGTVEIWPADFKKQAGVLKKADVSSWAFSASGQNFTTRSNKTRLFTVWKTATATPVSTLEDSDIISSNLRLSSDVRYALATTSAGTTRIWNVMSGEVLADIPGGDSGLRMLPGKAGLVSVGDGRILHWPLWIGDEDALITDSWRAFEKLQPLTPKQQCDLSMEAGKKCSPAALAKTERSASGNFWGRRAS